jgi:hypothetical protein
MAHLDGDVALNHCIENNASHLETHAEIDRILARRPAIVVMERLPRNQPVNAGSRKRALAYVRRNCRSSDVAALRDGPDNFPVVVFGECAVERSIHAGSGQNRRQLGGAGSVSQKD